MLNSSARNCRFLLSVKWKFFSAEKSHCCIPGPLTMFRPALPYWPICVTGFSRWNAPGLNQQFGVPACEPLGQLPCVGSPTRLGRSLGKPEITGAPPPAETPAESYTVKGVPVCATVTPLTCQPPRMWAYHSCECLKNGKSHW